MYIAIVCQPGCDAIHFKIKSLADQTIFSAWPKSQDKNLNILGTKRAFQMKHKLFFFNFQGLSVAKNYLRPKVVPLTI